MLTEEFKKRKHLRISKNNEFKFNEIKYSLLF